MSTALALDPVRRPVVARPLDTAPIRPAAPAGAPRPAALPVARPRVLAAAALMAGVAAVVAAQLLLSIGTADGAYRLAALEQRSDSLARRQQVQAEELRALAAPQRLAARAAALGMVPDDSPAYLDARKGRVLGSAVPTSGRVRTPGGLTR